MSNELPSLKWGEAGKAGFQLLPDVLLKYQSDLKLSAMEMIVLINITMHWWYKDQRPFPRATVIAKRIGVDTRTVQRAIKRLQELKMIEKVTENHETGERTVCDLTGLVSVLSNYAIKDPEYLIRTQEKNRENYVPF